MTARLAAVGVGGGAEPWVALGFAVGVDGRIGFANGAIEVGRGDALVIADRADLPDELDGVVLVAGHPSPPVDHPNGAIGLDHVVIVTDSMERTSAAIESALGLEQRRVREIETMRQGFHRFPDRGCIIEVVEPRDRPPATPRLFGVVVNVADLDDVVARLGHDLISVARAAVQPGRRIATVRKAAGLPVPAALMTPDP